MAVEWFCRIMGSEVGPLNQAQLVDMVRQHQVNPEDLVRRNNSAWVPAFEVKGLFEAAAKPAPPPPPAEPEAVQTEAKPDTQPAEPRAPVAESDASHHRVDAGHANATTAPRNIATDNGKADWFCIASGEKRGPLGFDELKSLASDGKLRAKDRVWRGSWPKFQKAAEIEGLTTE